MSIISDYFQTGLRLRCLRWLVAGGWQSVAHVSGENEAPSILVLCPLAQPPPVGRCWIPVDLIHINFQFPLFPNYTSSRNRGGYHCGPSVVRESQSVVAFKCSAPLPNWTLVSAEMCHRMIFGVGFREFHSHLVRWKEGGGGGVPTSGQLNRLWCASREGY